MGISRTKKLFSTSIKRKRMETKDVHHSSRDLGKLSLLFSISFIYRRCLGKGPQTLEDPGLVPWKQISRLHMSRLLQGGVN